MGQVLVLNASYEPLNITTWRRAMVMMIKGKAESLEQDTSREIRRGTHLPTVIRLRQYVHVPFRQLPLTRRNLFQRDHQTCQYCGSRDQPLSIDHVVPRSRGGSDTWENVTTACLSCNVRKGNRTPKEASMPLHRAPHRPLSSFSFEASRHIHSGRHSEWSKYVIGS
tara:strand:+ start:911 stop:1411 length:501 start_codon:yes stop_codon:yes gene_type:complete